MKEIIIKKIMEDLTIEEKASLCSGAGFWHTKAVDRLELPSVMVCDGPNGLRKQDLQGEGLSIGNSVKAVCFPTASALACSFDKELLHTLGSALGDECQAEEVSTLLGPGVNMKRSPLCGRNFEYLSEDPYLAGELAASYVNGVQSKNIGTSVKHFAVNNQETKRMSISAEVDERTLREIYLSAFETIVKKAKPWTMMCSYNCINGIYSCENDWLLNKILREEWGFDGLVMTDWGAMNDRVKAVKAGLDLEMPSSGGITDQYIVEAIKNGSLNLDELNLAVERVLTLVKKYSEGKIEGIKFELDAHHKLAKKIATECAVLLKNEAILPLKSTAKVAFIGEFAVSPRFQGGGSSHINAYKVTSALDASKKYEVSYAKGFDILKDELDDELVSEAVELAKASEVAVIFAGLPDHYESEGYDRTHLDIPSCQNSLIKKILKVQPNTVVVLHNGAPVLLPWANDVKAILEVYLSGQAVGEATVDLLFGNANPCGKLAETFPKRLQDNPSFLNFPGSNRIVEYKEGVFIGYRYYDAKEIDVLYPFGYGLSYTDFEYSNLTLKVFKSALESNQNNENNLKNELHMKDTDTLQVTLTVKNIGTMTGKEIVQLYVMDKEASVSRPPLELKGFEKVFLKPGEKKIVTFLLDKRSFAYYSTEIENWYAESGIFDIKVGKSSRNIVLTGSIEMESTTSIPFIYDDRTTFSDVMDKMEDPMKLIDLIKGIFGNTLASQETTGEERMMLEVIKGSPLHSLRSFTANGFKTSEINDLIKKVLNNNSNH